MNTFVRFEGVFYLCSLIRGPDLFVSFLLSGINAKRSPDRFMFKEQSDKKNPITIQGGILEEILSDLDYVTELLTLPPYAGQRHNFETRMAREEWERMYGGEIKRRRALRDLSSKKWLDAQSRGNKMIIRISSDAIVTALKNRIASTTKILGNGMKCLLSYDFPVGSDKARKVWTRLIKHLGLKQEQQSLYSTEFDVGLELKALAKTVGAERWVRVFVSTEV